MIKITTDATRVRLIHLVAVTNYEVRARPGSDWFDPQRSDLNDTKRMITCMFCRQQEEVTVYSQANWLRRRKHARVGAVLLLCAAVLGIVGFFASVSGWLPGGVAVISVATTIISGFFGGVEHYTAKGNDEGIKVVSIGPIKHGIESEGRPNPKRWAA